MPLTGEAFAFPFSELPVENAPVRLRMMRSTTTAMPATAGSGTVDSSFIRGKTLKSDREVRSGEKWGVCMCVCVCVRACCMC